MKSIKVILYEIVHKQPYETDEVVDIHNIIVPKVMKQSIPASWKIDRALKFFNKHGYIDKPLLVEKILNEKGKPNQFLLVDQYTRYYILHNLKFAKVPVKYINEI